MPKIGTTKIRVGAQLVSLVVDAPPLKPGVAGGFALGPLLLQPEWTSRLMTPSQPTALCGSSLDWLEALR
jgi:hypothetical protein